MLLLIFIIFNFNLIINNAAAGSSLPEAYLITGVPQHKQINALSCGPGALEIVFDFWGVDIDQKAIADVARSSSKGTLTWDIMRAGHFSYLSAANGSSYPHEEPTGGFPERPIGYASFNYSSDNFWWPDLKALVASNIPVVLLMKYAPNDDTGHYRVIVGYDEIKKVVYFMDPWERDLRRMTYPDGTVTWDMTDFKNAWNYSKYGTSHPYWGAAIIPWAINLSKEGEITAGSELKVTANITYPCMQPFDCTAYSASNSRAEIILPPGMHIEIGQSRFNIGDLQAGGSATISWNVKLDNDAGGSFIAVKADGLVSGAVPDVKWPGVFYQAYSYTDRIGGEGRIEVK